MKCFDCENSRFCTVWGEVKCLVKKERVYKAEDAESCADFKKRTTGDIHSTPCHCDDCDSPISEDKA